MAKKRYPVVRQNNRYLPSNPSVKPSFKMNGSLPNIFRNNSIKSEHALSKGRIHCVAVQRTAIYKDAYGNKIVLKENQQTMNAPETMRGGLEFHDEHGKWRKK